MHYLYYWLSRLTASDPGRKRLNQARKATISLISSVFTLYYLLKLTGQPALGPVIVAGICGMLGIMTVMDDTKKDQQITTLLLAVSAALGVTSGSLLAWNAFLVSTLMISIIFCAFYFTRFGSRYFSLAMIGFMTVYISSFLKLSSEQFPIFYLAIVIGITFAYLYNFFIFKDSAHLLKKSMRSFHIQANLTFQLLLDTINNKDTSGKKLAYNVRKLREYASNVATDLKTHDLKEVWPGITTAQLRLYVFDTAMFIETLADSLQQLKKEDFFEIHEIRQSLIHVISSLQKAKVLAPEYEEKNLKAAREATDSLRTVTSELLAASSKKEEGQLYLLRRIESIATHVTHGALEIQQFLKAGKRVEEEDDNKQDVKKDDKENDNGLKPSTKKAFQALTAGTIAIFVGHLISPIQPYWVILTTFIVQLGTETVGRTYLKGFQRSVGTVIGAILGFGLAKIISGNSELEVLLIFLVVFCAFYLVTISYTAMSFFITILIAFIYDLLLGGISIELLGARVIDTIAGAAIAFLVSAVLLPTKTKDKVTETFTDYLDELNVYVSHYLKRFTDHTDIKALSGHAFELEGKVQAIKDESKPILQMPAGIRNTGLVEWITVFTAINYYAKHLVASSYQKHFSYPEQLQPVFPIIEEKLTQNIHALINVMQSKENTGSLYDLKLEREQIERLSPGPSENQGDLIHHLYYIWRINQSLLVLGDRMGMTTKD